MAVYEYLCPKCRDQFDLMRPMGEAEKPARCPRCGSEAQKVISGFSPEAGGSTRPADEPFNKRTAVGEEALEVPDGQRRRMAQESLLKQLEEVAGRIRLLERAKVETAARMEALEREKNEAVARTQALERQVGRLAALITLAGEKVEEILKVGANDDISQPPAVSVPGEPKILERLGEFSPDEKKELKERSIRPWRSS